MLDRADQQLGNYQLIRLLGQGGFAEVYLGEHVHLNTFAAIKILRTRLAEDGLESFRAEARTLAHLKHPNIVQVLDFGVDGLTPYFVMEYAPNGTLRQRHPRGFPVALNLVVSYVKQVAAALQYAHNQKFIHRDIKPENMLVGEQNQILLSDFGIAVVTASARAENPAMAAGMGNSAGTVSYMAPEQIQGQVVPASDQYALATVVYEWLTGSVPFSGSYIEIVTQQISATPAPLRKKNPSLPEDVEQVVLTALNKDPQRRFGRIEIFATALEKATQLASVSPAKAPSTTKDTQHPNILKEVSSMTAALIGPFGRTVIGPTKVTIGRAPDNMIVLSDPKVSSHHAEVRPEGAYFSVVDLSSSNGTFVNEQRITSGSPRLLQPGDSLRMGDTMFMFEVENVPQSYASGTTIRATPPPLSPLGVTPNIAGGTSYGMPNYNDYQGTPPMPPAYAPPPQQASPYSSETQIPTYISSQSQQPLFTPPQQAGQQPLFTPPPQAPPKPSPVLTIVLAVIALVIILGGIGGFFVIQHDQQVYNMNQTATASTNQLQTSATAAAAQGTAHAQATSQAMNATATAIVTSHYPPFTNVALFDPLTSSSSNWNSNTTCQFGSSGYLVSIQQAHTIQYCLNTSGNYGEMAYQVTMTIQQGNCGGLVFRVIDSKDLYFIDVCQDGSYDFGDYVNGTENLRYNTTQPSSAIIQGTGKQNVIAISSQGDTVNLYINGQNVDGITSQALTTSFFSMGHVGLLADNLGNPTVVSYTNAIVWTAQ